MTLIAPSTDPLLPQAFPGCLLLLYQRRTWSAIYARTQPLSTRSRFEQHMNDARIAIIGEIPSRTVVLHLASVIEPQQSFHLVLWGDRPVWIASFDTSWEVLDVEPR
jgi:hypothetical protein